MDASAWISAVAGLVGAIIGAAAAVGGQVLQARRDAKAEADREHKTAIEEILVRSQSIDLRAHEAIILAANAGSFAGLATRVLGSVTPIDYLSIFDRMNEEVIAMQRAAAQLWLFADEETVALTNSVVLASTNVMSAHQQITVGSIRDYVGVALLGRHAHDKNQVDAARGALAEARRALIAHSREQLRLSEADPFATAPSASGPAASTSL